MIILHIGWALRPVIGVLIRERQRGDSREGRVKTEVEIGVMLPQAKKCWGSQKLGRQGRILH